MAAARVASEELGFTVVVGIGTHSREFVPRGHCAARHSGVEALITDGTHPDRGGSPRCSPSWCSARRWSATSPSASASCAVISAPVRVRTPARQDVAADGLRGRQRCCSTPGSIRMMGLEEHLLAMFPTTSSSGRSVVTGRATPPPRRHEAERPRPSVVIPGGSAPPLSSAARRRGPAAQDIPRACHLTMQRAFRRKSRTVAGADPDFRRARGKATPRPVHGKHRAVAR